MKKTEECTALYDFEAQGEDELSIADGETLTVVERENEDWWTVKNKSGQQGVVPAQYVEVSAIYQINSVNETDQGCLILA